MGKPEHPQDDRGAEDQILSALARRALKRKAGQLPEPSDLDEDLLLRYIDGALTGGDPEALERRMLVDHDVRERLGILVRGLEDAGMGLPPPAPGLVARTQDALSRYVFHVADGFVDLLRGGAGGQALAHAAVRGAAAARAPTGFQIDREFVTAQGTLAARFELHAERAEVDVGALADLVVHVDVDGKPVEGVRCKLLRDGRAVDSREVEAVGCTFSRLSPARYDVELRKGGVEVGRVLFDLRG